MNYNEGEFYRNALKAPGGPKGPSGAPRPLRTLEPSATGPPQGSLALQRLSRLRQGMSAVPSCLRQCA